MEHHIEQLLHLQNQYMILSGNSLDSIKYPYFASAILPTKWLKKLFAYSASDHLHHNFKVFLLAI